MHRHGFTLIELSIVLVIIGLIVGGILVGQDLIKAAEVRAQISQIEKYNQAVNTFKSKFGATPGDMSLSLANQFGFTPGTSCGGTTQGQRDGNGLIDGWGAPYQLLQTAGETGLFWTDLTSPSAGNLIDGQFPNSGAPAPSCVTALALTTTQGTAFIGDYMPTAKIGHGNFISVYENSGYNWYGLSATTITVASGSITASGSIPVVQAYNMDKKADDGMPTSGSILAVYLNSYPPAVTAASSTPSDSSTTCYNTTTNLYSLSSLANYGANGNCALSFRFQ